MTKLLAFNWKMNPATLEEAMNLAKASDSKGVIIIPPFLFIEEVAKILKRAKLGAQDLSWEEGGSFTGEVSAIELKNLGVEYVIIGHSERRRKLNETDEMINKKVLAALKAGLKVILCVGEEKRELGIKNYELGIKKAKNYIKNQLNKDLKGIHNSLFKIHNSLVIAYEPAWAIGTGHSDTPKDAVEMIHFIKKSLVISHKLLVKVLYGGSVDGKNIKDFVEYLPRSDAKHLLRGKDIDGFLVGGASLKSSEVNKIIQICLKKQKV